MYKILLFVFVLVISIGSVFLCNVSTNSRQQHNKQMQNTIEEQSYNDQNGFLTDCIEKLTQEDKNLLNFYATHWVDNGIIDKQSELQAQVHSDCFKVVAQHQAKKFLCPEFAEKYKHNDNILPYVQKTQEKCIANKLKILRNLYISRGKK